jgi:dTDP-4-dehydrorhamnose reductase
MSIPGLVIIGSTGMLGRELVAAGRRRDVRVRGIPGPEDLDITDAGAVVRALENEGSMVVVNATGYTDVDGAEADPDEADRVNRAGPANLARTCRAIGALLVHYSTDYVFDGRASRPYRVDDAPNPISTYGRTKLDGERAVIESGCSHLLVRTSWLFAPHGRNFVRTILDLATRRPTLEVVDDQHGRPTYAPDLARITLDLVERGARGTFHAANAGHCTWYELATAIVEQAGLDCDIRPCATSAHPRPACRPESGILDLAETAALLGEPRPWTEALAECLEALNVRPVTQSPSRDERRRAQ